MRIIAGLYRGRRILPPSGRTTRPITDRVKESLFAILGERVRGAKVADIFAGTGSLGLEAISREAESCLFVEKDRGALRILRENIDSLGVASKASISAKNAWYFAKFAHPYKPLDLVFLDPPYLDSRDSGDDSPLAKLLVGLAEPNQLSEDATVVIRHESANPCLDRYDRLVLTDSRRYGSMALSFLTLGSPAAEKDELTPPE